MKYKSLLYILPFALGLSACSDEDTVDGGAASGAEGIVFAANINQYQSRLSADGGSWTEGDRIGAYMFAEGGDLIPFSGNVPYACTGSEQLVTFHAEAPLQFPEDGSAVEFKAYYPYSDSIVNDIYALTLDDQRAGTAAYDLMYAVSDKSWSQTDEAPSVALNFSHCLSKVILRFVGTDGTPMEAENVTIQGMQNHVALNLRTGNLSAQASKDTIAVFSAADGGHEAILYPCSLADQTVAYTVNGNEGSWTFSNNVFQAHPVTVGISDGVNTELLGGISKGTRIVTEVKVDGGGMPQFEAGGVQESSPFAPKGPGQDKKKKK